MSDSSGGGGVGRGNVVPVSQLTDQELLLEKLEVFRIQGRDKKGRTILRIVGKFFPGRELGGARGEEALKGYLEKRVFPRLGERPFVVVYVHTRVQRGDNFPGVAALRSVYEAVPPPCAPLSRPCTSSTGAPSSPLLRHLRPLPLQRRLKYVSRLEFLWEHMRKREVEIPEFVHDHDEELERRPLMDYGLESDHHRRYDAPVMDSAASMYSLRCIS
uniref:CRAL-TRIO domain-containing protein n=1 Tax=Ananas comosus var. bracteatus TaxID=296719 RepID=A0A6V7QPT5_ANACO|nr:unnamed protein product [Ananas comosus var. bracteatus]